MNFFLFPKIYLIKKYIQLMAEKFENLILWMISLIKMVNKIMM
jgi:hypothetical protein